MLNQYIQKIDCKREEGKLSIFCLIYSVQNCLCLRPQFSQLNEHKFKHHFGNTINAMCAWRAQVETTEHFILCCRFYSTID